MARYDAHVDWYDEFASTGSFVVLREHAVALLGPARGRCLDLGRGTDLALPLNAVLDTGLILTSVDEPRDEDPPVSLALRRRSASRGARPARLRSTRLRGGRSAG